MAKKKNPILEKKYKQGYAEGYKQGMAFSKVKFAGFLKDRFNNLEKVDGIGEKTVDKIINHFGEQYFERIKRKN